MKLLHPVNNRKVVGFSETERLEAKNAIYKNVIDSIVQVLQFFDYNEFTATMTNIEDALMRGFNDLHRLVAKHIITFSLRFFLLRISMICVFPSTNLHQFQISIFKLLEALDDFGMKLGNNQLEADRDSVASFFESIDRNRSNRASAIAAIPIEELVRNRINKIVVLLSWENPYGPY